MAVTIQQWRHVRRRLHVWHNCQYLRRWLYTWWINLAVLAYLLEASSGGMLVTYNKQPLSQGPVTGTQTIQINWITKTSIILRTSMYDVCFGDANYQKCQSWHTWQMQSAVVSDLPNAVSSGGGIPTKCTSRRKFCGRCPVSTKCWQ